MESMIQQVSALFEPVRQPVLIMEGTQLLYQNPAAAVQLPALEPEQLSALQEGKATLGGVDWLVTERQMDTLRVLTLDPVDDMGQIPLHLLEVVAQTMRTPLSTAMAVSQALFLQLEQLDDPRIQRKTAALNRSFYQLLRLASNLSDLGDYFNGTMLLRRRPVEVVQWMEELGVRLREYSRTLQITMEIQTPQEPCRVWLDISQVERAVLNLVSNAMKFTKAGGRIVLRLGVRKHRLWIKVMDDGEGIASEVLESLYWRAGTRPPLGDPRWGAGLGMQLVRQVAIAHGGTVMVEPREGGGTCATISLELARQSPEALNSPTLSYDYSGGFDPILLELSDALPVTAFDSRETL